MVFNWSRPVKIPNLRQLLENVREKGGAIIEYQSIVSLLIVSEASPKFVWVAPSGNRKTAGLKYVILSCICGWWSITGLFWTPNAIIGNLMGGLDVTKMLLNPDSPLEPDTILELTRAQKRHQLAFLAFLLIVLGIIALVSWKFDVY